ncbi:MAG: hypothetical protein DWH80_10320 [Planctomycetota bacterium]|nr:MAG: hypothetical protein DWH80_10320 [Planctomycetota bacterium]
MVIPTALPRSGHTLFSATQPLHCIVNRKLVSDSLKRWRQLTAPNASTDGQVDGASASSAQLMSGP